MDPRGSKFIVGRDINFDETYKGMKYKYPEVLIMMITITYDDNYDDNK